METKELASALADIKATFVSSIEEIAANQRKQQAQVDVIDLRSQNITNPAFSGGTDTVTKALQDSEELARMIKNRKGRATIALGDLNQVRMETKVLTGSSQVGTSGVIMPERLSTPIVNLAQRRLFLRDLLYRGQKTTANDVYFIQEQSFANAASPQTEGSLKNETTDTFTTKSLPVATIAHFLMATRQLLDDAPLLGEFIKTKLLYGLRYKEEQFALSGDGTNGNLTGLLTVASTYNTALSGSTYSRLDILRRALEQVELSDEVPAGFFCLNPADVAAIELIKTTQGSYVVGNPGGSSGSALTLWGKPVINTTAIAAGTFLCGSSESAEMIDRLDATVELSYEDRDNFIRNQVTILCETRTVLVCYRPNAFVYGNLNSSP